MSAVTRPRPQGGRPPRPAVCTMLLGLLVVLGLLAAACDALPQYTPESTYYVSPEGDDGNNGQSPKKAWRTLERADAQQLSPGDRLLLRADGRFPGKLELRAEDAGSTDHPVMIGSYGEGRASIEASDAPGITVYNTSGVEIRDLVITGDKAAYRSQGGIHVYSDLAEGKRLRHLAMSGLEITGFRAGIQMGSAHTATGFSRVRISDTQLHGNKDFGLLTYGPDFDASAPAFAHRDVVVDGVDAHHNSGDPTADERHTGSGIVLGSVRGGKVQRSTAHDNGARSSSAAPEGPVGIWGYDASELVLERNTSYRNHTGSQVDGAGFGLDQNVSQSVVQHNLSFGNDGPGFHAYTGEENDAHTGNTIRFNISSDDGRKLPAKGSIDIHGMRLHDLAVYNNTVVITGTGRTESGPAVRLMRGMTGVTLRNNLLRTDGSPFVIADETYSPAEVLLQGNAYVSVGDRWALRWGERSYDSLRQWREATEQERAGREPTGMADDSCLAQEAAPVIKAPDQAKLLAPTCGVLAGKGLDLRARYGIDPGPVDYFGTALTGGGLIGAAQPQQAD